MPFRHSPAHPPPKLGVFIAIVWKGPKFYNGHCTRERERLLLANIFRWENVSEDGPTTNFYIHNLGERASEQAPGIAWPLLILRIPTHTRTRAILRQQAVLLEKYG